MILAIEAQTGNIFFYIKLMLRLSSLRISLYGMEKKNCCAIRIRVVYLYVHRLVRNFTNKYNINSIDDNVQQQ